MLFKHIRGLEELDILGPITIASFSRFNLVLKFYEEDQLASR